MVFLTVEIVENGYQVITQDDDGNNDRTWIASTQDEVAKVVKGIIRGAFGTDDAKREKRTIGVSSFDKSKKQPAEEKADES